MMEVTPTTGLDSFGSGHSPAPGSSEHGNESFPFPAKYLSGP